MSFEVRPAHADETPLPDEEPRAYALRVARRKAVAVEGALTADDTDVAVLAADTVVALEGRIFGKPGDPAEARAMLRALSGRTHLVHTAVVLLGGRVQSRVVTSRVTFRALTDRDVEWYLATGEPFDKAGGYGIQGDGALLVDRLQGSYTNVMGLPLRETLALIDRIAR